MAEIIFDSSNWPVLITTAPPEPVTDAELHQHIQDVIAAHAANEGPYVNVLDLTTSSGITAAQRKQLAEHIGKMEKEEGRCRGTALVFESPLLRGILTAIMWLRRPEYPTRVFATVTDAVAWGRGLIEGGNGVGAASAGAASAAPAAPPAVGLAQRHSAVEMLRAEIAEAQRCLMTSDMGRLDSEVSRQLNGFLFDAASRAEAWPDVMTARSGIEALWLRSMPGDLASRADFTGTQLMAKVQDSAVLSVLTKHLRRAA